MRPTDLIAVFGLKVRLVVIEERDRGRSSGNSLSAGQACRRTPGTDATAAVVVLDCLPWRQTGVG